MLLLLSVAAGATALPSATLSDWPHQCTPNTPNYTAFNQTRCPASGTCMPNLYSLSGYGCSPFANATICNAFQSCPSTTSCVLAHGSGNYTDLHTVYSCVDRFNQSYGSSKCSCKPGAPLPPSPTLKNVLIVGDSISIGYTPFVAAALADIAQVQHAPWSGDGGAEESAYALQCFTYWMRSPSGLPVPFDLIYYNTGMHNTLQGAPWAVPGQSGDPAAYPGELEALTSELVSKAKAEGTKLIFGVTSPMLCNASIDYIISDTLNPAARLIMEDYGVPTVDLYQAVTSKCGAVPQASCFNTTGCFCPHCSSDGYTFLAETVIAPAIRAALLA
jgi:hypothetical protein